MTSEIQFDDFAKLDLRVAEIESVEEIEGADLLWKINLDVGELGKRIICAGMKKYYSREELEGKKIIIVANLAPRKMRGIESQGMMLAAGNKDAEEIAFLTPEKDIPNGTRVS